MRRILLGSALIVVLGTPAQAQTAWGWFYTTLSCTVGNAQGTFRFGLGQGDPAKSGVSCGPGCAQSEGVTGGRFVVPMLADTYLTEVSSTNSSAVLAGPNGTTWTIHRNASGFTGWIGSASSGQTVGVVCAPPSWGKNQRIGQPH